MAIHKTIDTICATVDRIMAPPPAGSGGGGALVAAGVDEILGDNPVVRHLYGTVFFACPMGNPELGEALSRFRPWLRQKADAARAVLDVCGHAAGKDTRRALEACVAESRACRIALALCLIRGDGGDKDESRALELAMRGHAGGSEAAFLERTYGHTPFYMPLVLNEIGAGYFNSGKAETAQKLFARALELAPSQEQYLHNYCIALVEQGRYAAAFPCLCKACEGGNETLYYHLGHAYYYYYGEGGSVRPRPMAESEPRCRKAVEEAARWLARSGDRRRYPLLSKIYFSNRRWKDSGGSVRTCGLGMFSPVDALAVCTKGAEEGDKYSMACLGMLFAQHQAEGKDRDWAARWMAKSLEGGGSERHELYRDALDMMAMYWYANPEEEVRYLERYVRECPDCRSYAHYKLGMAYYDNGNLGRGGSPLDVIDCMEKAYGKMQQAGNMKLAFKLMPQVCSLPGKLCYDMAGFNRKKYEERGLQDCKEKARDWYCKALRCFENGLELANTEEGNWYAGMCAVYLSRLDYQKAEYQQRGLAHFKRVVALGREASAPMVFSLMHVLDGGGYPKEHNELVDYAFLSAQQGSAPAQYFLAVYLSAYNNYGPRPAVQVELAGKTYSFTTDAKHYVRQAMGQGHARARRLAAFKGWCGLKEQMEILSEMTKVWDMDERIDGLSLDAQEANYRLAKLQLDNGMGQGVAGMRSYLDSEEGEKAVVYKGRTYHYRHHPVRAWEGLEALLRFLVSAGKAEEARSDLKRYYRLKERADGNRVLNKMPDLKASLEKLAFGLEHPALGKLKKWLG